MTTATYTEEEIRAAHQRAGGNLDNMLAFLDGKRPADPKEWVNTLELACEARGVDVKDYGIPANGTAKEKADAYWKRLMLYERVFNRADWWPDITDTNQKKYYAYANVIKDSNSPFGFRLAYFGFVFVNDCSDLGARPEFERPEDAIYVFKTFTSDHEGFIANLYLSKRQNQ